MLYARACWWLYSKKKETGSSGLLQVYIQLNATAANESLGQSVI